MNPRQREKWLEADIQQVKIAVKFGYRINSAPRLPVEQPKPVPGLPIPRRQL